MEKEKSASAFLIEQAVALAKAKAAILEYEASTLEEGSDASAEETSSVLRSIDKLMLAAINCGREY